jgi:hypothetical protein
VLVGVDGDLHPVTQPELGEDAGDVALDRVAVTIWLVRRRAA